MFSQLKKINRQFIVYLVLLLLGLIILNAVSVIYVRKNSYQQTQETLELKLQQVTEKLQDKVFIQLKNAVEIISSNSEIIFSLQQHQANDYTQRYLADIKQGLNVNTVYLMNEAGTVIAGTNYGTSDQSFVGNNYSFRPYFKRAMAGEAYVYGALGKTSQQRGFYFSSPIRSGGEAIGVVVIKVGLKKIEDIMKEVDNPIFLLSPKNVVFASNRNQYLYNLFYDRDNIKQRLAKIEQEQQFSDQKIIPRRFSREDNKIFYDKVRYLFNSAELGVQGWSLIMMQPIESFFYTERYENLFWVIEFIILSLGVIIFILLVNKFYKSKLENKLRKFSKIVEQNPVSIVITNLEGNIEYVNKAFEAVTGYQREEIKGENIRILKTDKFDDKYYEQLWSTIKAGETWEGEFYNRKKNGDCYWERSRITPLKNKAGQIEGFVDMKENIDEEKKLKRKLEFLAERDELTNTYNRRAGYEIIKDKKKIATENNQQFSIAFIDINNLKIVNDTYGHDYGDELIIKVVETIKTKVRQSDYIIRFGGDEFIILFDQVEEPEASQVMARIQQKLQKINNQVEYEVSISYGLATYSAQQDLTVEELISKADDKMYQFKVEYKEKHNLKKR